MQCKAKTVSDGARSGVMMMKSGRPGSFTAFNGPLMRVARGIKNLPFVAHALNGGGQGQRKCKKIPHRGADVFLKSFSHRSKCTGCPKMWKGREEQNVKMQTVTVIYQHLHVNINVKIIVKMTADENAIDCDPSWQAAWQLPVKKKIGLRCKIAKSSTINIRNDKNFQTKCCWNRLSM